MTTEHLHRTAGAELAEAQAALLRARLALVMIAPAQNARIELALQALGLVRRGMLAAIEGDQHLEQERRDHLAGYYSVQMPPEE